MASNGAFAQLMRDYGDAGDQEVTSQGASGALAAATVDVFCSADAGGEVADPLPPPPSKLRSMSSGSEDGAMADLAKSPREKGQLIVKEEKALGSVELETWLQ